mgnify:FL=1
MKKFKKSLFLCMLGIFLIAGNALAVPIIDFAFEESGGQMFFENGNAVGVDIPITIFSVEDVPNYADGVVGTVDGLLNFDTVENVITITGTLTLPPPVNSVGNRSVLSGHTKANGGVITGTLLSGSFDSFQIIRNNFFGSGPDVKNPDLLEALGLPRDQEFAFFGFSLGGNLQEDGSYTAISVDFKNTAVPEPSTMLLIGTGLAFLGILGRKRMKL